MASIGRLMERRGLETQRQVERQEQNRSDEAAQQRAWRERRNAFAPTR